MREKIYFRDREDFRDREELDKKVARMQEDGAGGLYVVADFDRTLTRAKHPSIRIHTTHGQLHEPDIMPPGYVERVNELFEEYYPIELNNGLSLELREEKMQEWWNKNLEAQIEFGMSREKLEKIVGEGRIHLRGGCGGVLKQLAEFDVPLLVYSAGVGSMISAFLKQEEFFYGNMSVLSNFYSYDDDGRVVGYRSELIHACNKTGRSIRESEFFDDIEERRNVVVLGDMIQDMKMIEEVETDCVLGIGFVNSRKSEDVREYLEAYDVVIADSESMHYCGHMFNRILRFEKEE